MRILPAYRPDIPFSRDDANRFLPWIVALMVCLTTLMLSVGLSLEHMLVERHAGFSEQVTVQIPGEVVQADMLARVHKTLQSARGITAVADVEKTEVEAMISPWINDETLLRALALPTVIRASVAHGQRPDLSALTDALKSIDTRIALDTHELWALKFSRFSHAVELGLYALASCIIATLAFMVIFMAREGMKLHRRTVLLLHAIGADDHYIARQFQANALRVTFKGACIGTLLGIGLYATAGTYTKGLNAPLLPDFAFSPGHIFTLSLLPFLCGVLALLSARFAVGSQLKALP